MRRLFSGPILGGWRIRVHELCGRRLLCDLRDNGVHWLPCRLVSWGARAIELLEVPWGTIPSHRWSKRLLGVSRRELLQLARPHRCDWVMRCRPIRGGGFVGMHGVSCR